MRWCLNVLVVLLGALLGLTACTRGPTGPAAAKDSSGQTTAHPPKTQPAGKLEVAILAGGCFWGMEEILRKVPGVVDTEVGYTGGNEGATSYEQVKSGTTGQAEAVRIRFDPSKLSYEELLEKWFFRMHDPTTKN